MHRVGEPKLEGSLSPPPIFLLPIFLKKKGLTKTRISSALPLKSLFYPRFPTPMRALEKVPVPPSLSAAGFVVTHTRLTALQPFFFNLFFCADNLSVRFCHRIAVLDPKLPFIKQYITIRAHVECHL